MRSNSWVPLVLTMVAGCAATEPFPPAPTEVLVLINSTQQSLSVITTRSPHVDVGIPLGSSATVPAGLAARGGLALVPLGDDDAVAVVDLGAGTVLNTYPLAANSGATGAAIVDDSIGYVANPGLNTVTRLNYLTGDTASVAVGVHPDALVYTRGKLFVLNADLNGAGHPVGSSWLTVIDPVTNARATGIDSIPLLGPGNARSAVVGADGLLYVMSAGDSGVDEGRLSIVNPVTRVELANFGGFGTAPSGLGAAGELLLVSSWTEGVMSFNTHLREIIRGAGAGVPVPQNTAVVAGADGKIYALSAGMCSGGISGIVDVLRPTDLAQTGTITLTGECHVGAVVTTVPAP